ncbi:hypothetical protein GCM10010218_27080 [Streptomyces mashuensis]|uniref:Uncharacterized protein n=1 Tax=Streptomyces mashuensis TaxID=33904 RepID=A0A919ECY9_9ACTN|nr:hypothetical protein [Streptomyces mashuensis]GHF44339.1 hypothetical protein GCM10010218_27080 [Streptomyces mashuensis]
MSGFEVAAGFLGAWAVQKVRRVAGRADAEVDRAVDAAMDDLHELVSTRLGEGAAEPEPSGRPATGCGSGSIADHATFNVNAENGVAVGIVRGSLVVGAGTPSLSGTKQS